MLARSNGNLRTLKETYPFAGNRMAFLSYWGNTSVFISSVEEKRNFGNTPNTFASLEIYSKNIQVNNKH